MILKIIFLLFFFLESFFCFAGNDLYSTVGELGFSPMKATPPDFEIEDLKGERHRLSDLKGKWIWLNFWATWCGPCREEMPSLQALSVKLEGTPFHLLGVSVDQGHRNLVEKFVQKNQLTFPIWHDTEGKASSLYQASSIPIAYLISPDWNIVGVFRGGRDWDNPQVFHSLNKILSFKETPDDFTTNQKSIDTPSEIVELPNNLVPPQLEVSLSDDPLIKNQEYLFKVRVQWPQNSKEYFIRIPEIKLEGDSLEILNVSSSALNDKILSYDFTIKPKKEGEVNIGPILLSYRPKVGGKELFARHEGIKKSVENFSKKYTLIGIIFIIIVLISFFVFLYLKKKSSSTANEIVSRSKLEIENDLNKTMLCKIEGRQQEFALGLLKLYENLANENFFVINLEEREEIQKLIEKINFSGFIPSPEKLKLYENKIKSLFKTEDSDE